MENKSGKDLHSGQIDLSPIIQNAVLLNKWVQRLMYQSQTASFSSDFAEGRIINLAEQIEDATAMVKSVTYILSEFEVWP